MRLVEGSAAHQCRLVIMFCFVFFPPLRYDFDIPLPASIKHYKQFSTGAIGALKKTWNIEGKENDGFVFLRQHPLYSINN